MTYVYQMFGYPNELDIICPFCQGHAKFFFAQFIKIREKKDIIHFKNNPNFEYAKTTDFYGLTEHIAIYYPNLYGVRQLTDDDFPKGYQSTDFYSHNYQKIGVCVCQKCGKRHKHQLNWQKDAYYQTTIKNQPLWAFDRQHLISIKHFIQSHQRCEHNHSKSIYLFHLPTIFKEHKNRNEVVKKIDKLLMSKF